MSATLALKVAAPVFAFAVAGLIWAAAGPLAAGLSLITFLLGVVTSELDHMRWKPVAETGEAPAADSAFLALLAAGAVAPDASPPEPEQPAGPPKRNFRCTAEGLAIGSGKSRLALVQRARRERPPVSAPPEPQAGLAEAGYAVIDDELFAPVEAEPESVQPSEPSAVQPATVLVLPVEPPAAQPAPKASRTARTEPPPPTVRIFHAAHAERVGRR